MKRFTEVRNGLVEDASGEWVRYDDVESVKNSWAISQTADVVFKMDRAVFTARVKPEVTVDTKHLSMEQMKILYKGLSALATELNVAILSRNVISVRE